MVAPSENVEAALDLLESSPDLVERLSANAATLRTALEAEGLPIGASSCQIVPVRIGDAAGTMELCERLLEGGIFAQGIRPPTVPPGTSRIRFTLLATHTEEHIERALSAVQESRGFFL